jgi:hypothetical protein
MSEAGVLEKLGVCFQIVQKINHPDTDGIIYFVILQIQEVIAMVYGAVGSKQEGRAHSPLDEITSDAIGFSFCFLQRFMFGCRSNVIELLGSGAILADCLLGFDEDFF